MVEAGGGGNGDKTEGDGESDKEGGMGQPQRANRGEIEERKGGRERLDRSLIQRGDLER